MRPGPHAGTGKAKRRDPVRPRPQRVSAGGARAERCVVRAPQGRVLLPHGAQRRGQVHDPPADPHGRLAHERRGPRQRLLFRDDPPA